MQFFNSNEGSFEDFMTFAVSECGCYMTNASCGGSSDFNSAGQPTRDCAQSYLSAGQPAHTNTCPTK